jgi:hypothetical protein
MWIQYFRILLGESYSSICMLADLTVTIINTNNMTGRGATSPLDYFMDPPTPLFEHGGLRRTDRAVTSCHLPLQTMG